MVKALARILSLLCLPFAASAQPDAQATNIAVVDVAKKQDVSLVRDVVAEFLGNGQLTPNANRQALLLGSASDPVGEWLDAQTRTSCDKPKLCLPKLMRLAQWRELRRFFSANSAERKDAYERLLTVAQRQKATIASELAQSQLRALSPEAGVDAVTGSAPQSVEVQVDKGNFTQVFVNGVAAGNVVHVKTSRARFVCGTPSIAASLADVDSKAGQTLRCGSYAPPFFARDLIEARRTGLSLSPYLIRGIIKHYTLTHLVVVQPDGAWEVWSLDKDKAKLAGRLFSPSASAVVALTVTDNPNRVLADKLPTPTPPKQAAAPRWWMYATIGGIAAVVVTIVVLNETASESQRINVTFRPGMN